MHVNHFYGFLGKYQHIKCSFHISPRIFMNSFLWLSRMTQSSPFTHSIIVKIWMRVSVSQNSSKFRVFIQFIFNGITFIFLWQNLNIVFYFWNPTKDFISRINIIQYYWIHFTASINHRYCGVVILHGFMFWKGRFSVFPDLDEISLYITFSSRALTKTLDPHKYVWRYH